MTSVKIQEKKENLF